MPKSSFGVKRSERIQDEPSLTTWRESKAGKEHDSDRVDHCYALILEGGTRKQTVERQKAKFNLPIHIAYEDYEKAIQVLIDDQDKTNENLKELIQAMRFVGMKKALAKGNLQAFSMMLKDMGAVINETETNSTAENINLNISIEGQGERNNLLPGG